MLKFDIFKTQFPLYQCKGLTCDGEKVVKAQPGEKLLLSRRCDQLYYNLYSGIKEGQTIEEVFVFWSQMVQGNVGYVKWSEWLYWHPDSSDWWFGDLGLRYHISEGVVQVAPGLRGLKPAPMNSKYKEVLAKLHEGMTLEEARTFMMANVRGGKRWTSIYNFAPPTTDDPQESADVPHNTNGDGIYTRNNCPELLSTTAVDVRVLYPQGDSSRTPDQVQVILYALTRVWDDARRTKVNPRLKETLREYFDFAYKQAKTHVYMRQHPSVYSRMKSRALRVTKDCCIEVDFDIVSGEAK